MNVQSLLAANPPASAPWNSLSRRGPSRSPLEAILGEGVAGPFSAAQLARLRMHVARSVPVLPDPGLELVLGALMDRPEILSAYFRPTRVFLAAQRQPLVQVVLPIDCALDAARKAGMMPGLLPQERSLAWLAAFVYPVAHFYMADTARGAAALTEMPAAEQLRELRLLLVEDALRLLRIRHRALADTLAAGLDFGVSDICEPQQVARLVSAVRLAVLRIDQLWKEIGDV